MTALEIIGVVLLMLLAVGLIFWGGTDLRKSEGISLIFVFFGVLIIGLSVIVWTVDPTLRTPQPITPTLMISPTDTMYIYELPK